MNRTSAGLATLALCSVAAWAQAAKPGSYFDENGSRETAATAEMFETEAAFQGDPAVYEVDGGNEYVADDSGLLPGYAGDVDSPVEMPHQHNHGPIAPDGPPAQHHDSVLGPIGHEPPCSEECDCWYCNRPHRMYGRLEYLQYWVKGANTPPLVTTNADPNTPEDEAGVLPGADILFGNRRVDANRRVGGRYTLGWWLDDCQCNAVEANFFQLEDAGTFFQAASDGSTIIGRPFIDVTNGLPGVPAATLVSYRDVVAGRISVSTHSRVLGSEVNWRHAMRNDCYCRIDMLAGYRFFRMDEGLRVSETTSDLTGAFPPDTVFNIVDRFATENRFHGGQLGLQIERKLSQRWSLDLLGKFAIGGLNQRVNIGGNTVVVDQLAGPTVIPGGGILALGSNSGNFSRSRFSFLPEFGANLHYAWKPNCRLTAGYSLIYMTNAVRPGDQIDTRLDTDQFPPPLDAGVFPAFAFRESDLWIQGINLGLEARF